MKTQMRDMLKVQELMDIHLDQRDEELRQLCSQSQVDGAQLAALSMQVQELISSMETRAEVVGKNLEEINGRFDCPGVRSIASRSERKMPRRRQRS